jgi:hypothetical protein
MSRFIGTSLQLQPITTAHNQWLSKTHSIHYWTIRVFSSTVTNDERQITAHTLNSSWITNYDSCLTNVLLIYEKTLFYNSGWTDERAPSRTVNCCSPVVTGMSLLIFIVMETCQYVATRWLAYALQRESVFTEPLPSKWSHSSQYTNLQQCPLLPIKVIYLCILDIWKFPSLFWLTM